MYINLQNAYQANIFESMFHEICRIHNKINYPLSIGIDGMVGSGRMAFAEKLAEQLRLREGLRAVIFSLDDFWLPPEKRHLRGNLSALDYYRNWYDYTYFRKYILSPLGPEGNLVYRHKLYDREKEAYDLGEQRLAQKDMIYIVEGMFALRRELVGSWHYRILLEVRMRRAFENYIATPTGETATMKKQRFIQQYLPAYVIHLQTSAVRERAHSIIDNNDPIYPSLISIQEALGEAPLHASLTPPWRY